MVIISRFPISSTCRALSSVLRSSCTRPIVPLSPSSDSTGLTSSGECPVNLAVAAGVAPGPQVGQDARRERPGCGSGSC